MKKLFLSAALLVIGFANAQVKIGNNPTSMNPASILELESTTQGFLMPRLTYAQKTSIATPPAGLIVWCTDCGFTGEMQFFNGTIWVASSVVAGTLPTPGAPTSPVATPAYQQASVTFIAPASIGASVISGYTVTSSPGGITATGITSPIIVIGLTNNTSYTFTVVATNSNGDSVASVASNAVTPFPSVTICAQVWMQKNLDVTTYRDGTPIPYVTNDAEWAALTTGAYCSYGNQPGNDAIYGKLYNWYAVNDPRGLAPTDWHVPTDVEWTTLTDCLGSVAVAGNKMKETGTTHWSFDSGATNSSGFTGLPGGYRIPDGTFIFGGNYGFWWSSSEIDPAHVWFRHLNAYNGNAGKDNSFNKTSGFSVRCLSD